MTAETTDYRSPLTSRRGAVAAGAPDEGVAANYGEPAAEQRALERGIGVVDASHRGVVTVTGPDRLSWLDTLSSQWLRSEERRVGREGRTGWWRGTGRNE